MDGPYRASTVHDVAVTFFMGGKIGQDNKRIVTMLNFLKYLIAYGIYFLVSSVGMFVFTIGVMALFGGFAVLIGKGDRTGTDNEVWVLQFASYFLAYLSGALAGLFALKLWASNFSWPGFISCVGILNFWHTYRQRFSYATDNAARLGYRQRIANHSGALTAFVLASVIINL